jgi:hypothetical protein
MSDVFWAAFGGGAAAGIVTLIAVLFAEWYRWFLDRPLVKVSLSTGFFVGQKDIKLFLEASNPHTKSVTLSSFGFMFRNKKWGTIVVNPQFGYIFPYELSSGKSLQQWSDIPGLLNTLKNDGKTPKDLKWVYFRSSAGKTYRGKIKGWVKRKLSQEFGK